MERTLAGGLAGVTMFAHHLSLDVGTSATRLGQTVANFINSSG